MGHPDIYARDKPREREEAEQSSFPTDFAAGAQFSGILEIPGIDQFGNQIRDCGLMESRRFGDLDT
jgi:hypothetical protein